MVAKKKVAELESNDPKVKDLKWAKDAVAARLKTFDQGWHSDADSTQKVYDAGSDESVPYNILFATTELMLPAVFSSTPIPSVSRKYESKDPTGLLVSQISEKVLTHLIDPNRAENSSYYDALENCVFDGLVPGLGAVNVQYKPQIQEAPEATPEGKKAVGSEESEDYSGESEEVKEPVERMIPAVLEFEEICVEHFNYKRFVWGEAKKWAYVPWVAFGQDLSFDAFEKRYGHEYLEEAKGGSDKAKDDKVESILVWQFWSKTGGWVGEFVPCCKTWLKSPEAPPYNITGFYPCPKPLTFVKRTNTLDPKPLYQYYAKQAEELNRVTGRLGALLNALRVRGVYHPSLAEIAAVLEGDKDNHLVPAQQSIGLLQDGGSLDKYIWLMPLEKIITVVQELYKSREQIKAVIYELSGLGDLIRGSTKASETLGAQQLKDKWGSVRLGRYRTAVAVYNRDVLRIMLEMASQVFQKATVEKIVGQTIPDPLFLAWQQVTDRTYRVDVETNSTVAEESVLAKEEIAEFMMALGQVMPGLEKLGSLGPTGVAAGKELLMAVTRRFHFGRTVEQAFEAIQPPPPPDPAKAMENQVKLVQAEAQAKAAVAGATAEAETKRELGLAEIKSKEVIRLAEIEKGLKIETATAVANVQTNAKQIMDTKTEQAGDAQSTALDRVQEGQAATFELVDELSQVVSQLQSALELILTRLNAPKPKAKVLYGPEGQVLGLEPDIASSTPPQPAPPIQ